MGGAGPQEESLVLFKKIILKKWYEGKISQFVTIPEKSNYWKIHQPLPGNSLATIENPLAPIGKLPTIGELTKEAKGFSGRG